MEGDVDGIVDNLQGAIQDTDDIDVDSIRSAIKDLEKLAERLR